ncbi:hypothetical protein [Fournierella massiliensis]|uniref:hypothetical protein n=1 Tax=Allofournierella massiliensis TaxID=1650663 RepID=UPI0035216292
MKEQNGNGFAPSIAQAIEEMKAEQGDSFSLERINLAELERRTGVSRSRLRRLKRNGFQDLPRSTKGSRHMSAGLLALFLFILLALGFADKNWLNTPDKIWS